MTDLWIAVLAGGRRADLAVPAELPVAELAVEAGRLLGTTGTIRSVTGASLDPAAPLGEQAVDGDLLVLADEATPRRPVRWDDPADAMAAAVSLRPTWTDRDTSLLRVVLGTAAAAVVGAHAWSLLPPEVSALAAMVVGLVAGLTVFVVRGPRFLAAVLAPGLLVVVTVLPWETSTVAPVASAVLVLGADLVPVAAVAGGAPAADVRDLVAAFHVAAGAVLVVAAASAGHPLAAAVVACAATLLSLRARRHLDRVEALTSVVGGVAPWLVLGVVALSEPAGRPVAAVVAAAVGAAAVLARPTARVVRMMDVTEGVLVLVLPTLVVGWVATVSSLRSVVLG